MNLNVYLEGSLYSALMAYSIKNNLSKNQIVKNAVTKILNGPKIEQKTGWSKEFQNWKGLGEDCDMFKPDYSMFKDDEFNKSWLD